MELKNTFYGIICSLSFTTVSYSQVGVGTLSPDQSSQLDISATNKGLLIPRVQLTQLSLQAPITGTATASLLVFNTQTINDVTPGFYFWNGSKWVRIINKEDMATFKETITSLEYDAANQMLTYKDEDNNLNEITLQGLTGPQGEVGPQGLPGTNGVDGLVGPQGLPGTNGVDGLVGPPGLPGTNGVDGLVGPQGLQGEIGPEGPAGLPPSLGAGNLSANDYIAVTDGSGTTFKNTSIELDLNKVKTDLATGTLSGTGVVGVDTGSNTLLSNASVKINPGISGQVLTTNASGTVLWQTPSKNLAIRRITASASINIIADEVILIDASAAGSNTITFALPASGPLPILVGKVFTVKRVDANNAATVRVVSGVNATIDETETVIILGPKNSYQLIIEAVAPFYKYQILSRD